MTEERLPLAELLEKAGEGDFLRAVPETVLQPLMETDVDGVVGAGRYERSVERTTWRNGYRDRALDTLLGLLQVDLVVAAEVGDGLGAAGAAVDEGEQVVAAAAAEHARDAGAANTTSCPAPRPIRSVPVPL